MRLKKSLGLSAACVALLLLGGVAHAETASAEVNLISAEGIGKSIGTVTFTDIKGGIEIKTALSGLPAGERGFHVHANGDCAPAAGADGKVAAGMAAGGHLDPDKTGKHMGPEKGGHKGDLPFLVVEADGKADKTLVVHGLSVKEVKGHAIMIHAGGDNYTDTPPLGGGGARIACGVIK